MTAVWVLYVAGVLVGVWRVDGPPATKVVVALLWPLGPLAFAVVILILVGASVIAFPWFGAVLVALGVGWWVLQS